MNKFLFRAMREFDRNEGIKCKNPKCTKNIEYHINFGSKKGVMTQYISCTDRISSALSYSYRHNQDKDSTIGAENYRSPIILIDSEKILNNSTINIYDLTDEEILNNTLSKAYTKYWATASREVLIEREIPSECCIEIPQLFIDLLFALESEQFVQLNSRVNYEKEDIKPKSYGAIKDILCENIFENKESLLNILENLELNKLEKDFFKYYYSNSNSRMTFKQLSQNIFNNNDELTNCIRSSLIKKIINGDGLKDLVNNHLKESKLSKKEPQYDNGVLDDLKKYTDKTNNYKKFGDNYLGTHEGSLSRINPSTDAGKKFSRGESGIIIAGIFQIPIAKNFGSKSFPYGIDIESITEDECTVTILRTKAEPNSDGTIEIAKKNSSLNSSAKIFNGKKEILNLKEKDNECISK